MGVINTTHRLLYPRARDPVPMVQEVGWAPRPVWTGVEKKISLTRLVFELRNRLARTNFFITAIYIVGCWRQCGVCFWCAWKLGSWARIQQDAFKVRSQSCSHWTYFHENWCLKYTSKICGESSIFIKNQTRITVILREDQYTFTIISRSVLLRMRNVSYKRCRENQNTHFIKYKNNKI